MRRYQAMATIDRTEKIGPEQDTTEAAMKQIREWSTTLTPAQRAMAAAWVQVEERDAQTGGRIAEGCGFVCDVRL